MEPVQTRMGEGQLLWVLAAPDGTVLCGRHTTAGLLLLAWTTRQELDDGVAALADRAPELFASHRPEQRSLRDLLRTAEATGLGLRIDDYLVLGLQRTRTPPEVE